MPPFEFLLESHESKSANLRTRGHRCRAYALRKQFGIRNRACLPKGCKYGALFPQVVDSDHAPAGVSSSLARIDSSAALRFNPSLTASRLAGTMVMDVAITSPPTDHKTFHGSGSPFRRPTSQQMRIA